MGRAQLWTGWCGVGDESGQRGPGPARSRGGDLAQGGEEEQAEREPPGGERAGLPLPACI